MKKMNGFNIILFVFIMVLIMNLSCAEKQKPPVTGLLLKSDREFSEKSVKEGMFRAFLSYIADDGVILRDNSLPSRGIETLRQYYSGKSDSAFILSWEPVYEKIAENGDIGYTYGIWTNTIKASGEKSQGTYVTVWQKQEDGSWKFVLDTGTSGLPESK
jgi:ketosteroid isomerase-like protein